MTTTPVVETVGPTVFQVKSQLMEWMSDYMIQTTLTDIHSPSARANAAWYIACKLTDTPITDVDPGPDRPEAATRPAVTDEVERAVNDVYERLLAECRQIPGTIYWSDGVMEGQSTVEAWVLSHQAEFGQYLTAATVPPVIPDGWEIESWSVKIRKTNDNPRGWYVLWTDTTPETALAKAVEQIPDPCQMGGR